MSRVVFTRNIEKDLEAVLSELSPSQVIVLTDENVNELIVQNDNFLSKFKRIVLPAGEENKNLENAQKVWEYLTDNKVDRKAVLINVGGGVIGDLGGFVAATYKRGINFINLPTTLLAQVDASVGGKTGINFKDFKNQIGCFREPYAVLINVEFLKTLPKRHLLSGFAEMIKHALISGESDWGKIKGFDLYAETLDFDYLEYLVKSSIKIKESIVEQDPQEVLGIRKILNFGHTIGHAVETFFLKRGVDILHGEAVAIGIIAEIYLSNIKLLFDFNKVFEISSFISSNFNTYKIKYEDYDEIIQLMLQDKKNQKGKINFTLLKQIGQPVIDQFCTPSEIKEALNFYFQFSG